MWYNVGVKMERVVAARLPKERLARARSLSIIEGSFATAMTACTGGTILTGFALWLGASPFGIGLLTSLPAFAGMAQLLAPYFTERQGQRKPLVLLTVAGQRLLWLPITLIPFLALPGAWGVALLVLLVTVSTMLGAVAAVPWLSWMGDLVPKDMRGRYFAMRTLVTGAVGLVLGPLVGLFLDVWQDWQGRDSPHGFVIAFLCGVGLGLISLWLLGRIVEPPMMRGEVRSLLAQLRLPWQNGNFRRLILFRGYYIFVVNLAGPFFVVYHLQGLGLSFATVYILGTIGNLAMLVSLRWWGPLCDRLGHRRVMLVNTVGKGIFPLLYIGMSVTAPGVPTALTWVLLVAAQLFGVSEAGLELAANNLQLNIAPREHNTAYLATYAAVFSLCSAVSPLIGGALLSQPAASQIDVGPLNVGGFQALFFISGLLRISSVFLARTVHER